MAQTTSNLWKELLQINGATREYAFKINGTMYGADVEESHSVTSELFSDFGIGNATSAKLTLNAWLDGVPKNSVIERYVRLSYEGQTTEWIPKGVFYSNKRVEDDGFWKIDAFDAMRKADVQWNPDPKLNFPMAMTNAVSEFCRILDVELDARTVLNSEYVIDYPSSGTTIRNELCWIAAAHGGNFVMTDTGKLRLVPLSYIGTAHNVGMDVIGFENHGQYKPISRVTLWLDGESCFTAGDDTGRELSAVCPTATQEMVNTVLSEVAGYEYKAYSSVEAALDPAAELGDIITVSGITSVVASISDDGNGFPDVSAPGEAELEEDDTYISPMQQEINRQTSQTRTLFEKTNEAIRASVTNVSNRVTQLELSDGQVLVSVEDDEGTLKTVIDAKTWEAIRRNLSGETTSGFWFDFEDGQFVFDGTGEFRSRDGLSYITIEGNELVLYSKRDGTALDKLRIGFVTGTNPAGTDEVDYPYILLGNTGNVGGGGLVKKFWNGLFIGNSYSKNTGGNFVPTNKDNGFFINISTGKSYAVQDGVMYDMIARADGSVALTTQEIGHNEEILADCMPVYVTQEQYDEMVAAGEYNPVTPYFIRREV